MSVNWVLVLIAQLRLLGTHAAGTATDAYATGGFLLAEDLPSEEYGKADDPWASDDPVTTICNNRPGADCALLQSAGK